MAMLRAPCFSRKFAAARQTADVFIPLASIEMMSWPDWRPSAWQLVSALAVHGIALTGGGFEGSRSRIWTGRAGTRSGRYAAAPLPPW